MNTKELKQYIPVADVISLTTKSNKVYVNEQGVTPFLSGVYVSNKQVNKDEDPNQTSLFAKGGRLPKDAIYIKNRDVDNVMVLNENGEEEIIDGTYLYNGFWIDGTFQAKRLEEAIKKGMVKKQKTEKPTPAKTPVKKKTEAPSVILKQQIETYLRKNSNDDPTDFIKQKLKVSDLAFFQKFVSDEVIMSFYCGVKSIIDVSIANSISSRGLSGYRLDGNYIENAIKRFKKQCENGLYEIGMKYPENIGFNYFGKLIAVEKHEEETKFYTYLYKAWRFKDAVVTKEYGNINKSTELKTETSSFNNLDFDEGYIGVVSKDWKLLLDFTKDILTRDSLDIYVKDYNFPQNTLGGMSGQDLIDAKFDWSKPKNQTKKMAQGGQTDLSTNSLEDITFAKGGYVLNAPYYVKKGNVEAYMEYKGTNSNGDFIFDNSGAETVVKQNEAKDIVSFAKGGKITSNNSHLSFKFDKDGYVKDIRDFKGKKQSEYVLGSVVYKFNPVYKNYNSLKNNKLLHKSNIQTSTKDKFLRGGQVQPIILDSVLDFSIPYAKGGQTDSLEAMEIAHYTGLRASAISEFLSENNLDAEKLATYVRKGKLEERMNITTAVAVKPNNKIQKEIINKFSKNNYAKGGQTDLTTNSLDDITFAKGGLIKNVGRIDDFMLKELLSKNKSVLSVLGKDEIDFMNREDVVIIPVDGKNYDFIFTDGKQEFEIADQERKLKKPLCKARPQIVKHFSNTYAKGGITMPSKFDVDVNDVYFIAVTEWNPKSKPTDKDLYEFVNKGYEFPKYSKKAVKKAFETYLEYPKMEFEQGGSIKNNNKPIEVAVKEAFVKEIGVDETLNIFNRDYPIPPYRLLNFAISKGWLKKSELSKSVIELAIDTSEDIKSDSPEEIGSSDVNGYIYNMLRFHPEIEMKYENGKFKRVFAKGGEVDTVEVNIPLLIRLMEYSREDAKDDVELHEIAERLTVLAKKKGSLDMQDYEKAVSESKKVKPVKSTPRKRPVKKKTSPKNRRRPANRKAKPKAKSNPKTKARFEKAKAKGFKKGDNLKCFAKTDTAKTKPYYGTFNKINPSGSIQIIDGTSNYKLNFNVESCNKIND